MLYCFFCIIPITKVDDAFVSCYSPVRVGNGANTLDKTMFWSLAAPGFPNLTPRTTRN